MTSERRNSFSRRDLLRAGMASLPLVAVVPTLLVGHQARAQQKASKEQVQYQDSPKDGQQCSKCMQFVPSEACKVVEGKVSPQGWCRLYTPKQD